MSLNKCKPKNENSVQFELQLKVNDSGSEIQSLSSNSSIDQSLSLKVSDSSSQIQSVPSNSAIDQPHFLNVSSSNSKPDIKAADRVFPSFLKVNSDLPTLKTKERNYKYDIANFIYRGSNLRDIQRKKIIQNVFVPNSSFHFPKVDGRQYKREWLKQFA